MYYFKKIFKNLILKNKIFKYFFMGIGDWGLGIGDWGLGIGPRLFTIPIPIPSLPCLVAMMIAVLLLNWKTHSRRYGKPCLRSSHRQGRDGHRDAFMSETFASFLGS